MALAIISSGAPSFAGTSKGPLNVTTRHLSVQATLSNAEVTPGADVLITFDVTPKAHMHVYAPGGRYLPICVRLDHQPLVKDHDLVYPQAETYFFEPLNERALVYSEPFQLVLNLTVGATPEQKAQLRARSRLTVKGVLEYQACDDRICYLPTSVPLEWNLKIKH